MDIYSVITEGIRKNLPPHISLESYLESLQKRVRGLRHAYFNLPVYVEYSDQDIQAAYLLSYFPHYYQLIHSILIEQCPEIFVGKQIPKLTFIGGGPGPEAYGVLKYIYNNCPHIKEVNVEIMDINGETWTYSHEILKGYLLKTFEGSLKINWVSSAFDLTSSNDIKHYANSFNCSDLIVIQNCLNEIAVKNYDKLIENISVIFSDLPPKAYLMLSDITSGARNVLKKLEYFITNKFNVGSVKSTLKNYGPTCITSIHHRPSELVAKYLLKGSDGLIPRKYIKYDYVLIAKNNTENNYNSALGLDVIYDPLEFSSLDPQDLLSSQVFIGLDFGTSCSVASMAYVNEGKIYINAIPIPQYDHLGGITTNALVPSAIALSENRLLVGKHAWEQLSQKTYGKDSWYSFKTNLAQLDKISYNDSLLASNPKVRIANASDALTVYFKYLKKEIDNYLNEKGLKANSAFGISIPAGYSSKEKKALKEHLEYAGILSNDLPFIEEPNAALINYLYVNRIKPTKDLNDVYIIIDIGGGTIDISVLHVSADSSGIKSKLLSVMRKGQIGSIKIDNLILNKILEYHPHSNNEEVLRLLPWAEQLKIKLCKTIHLDASVSYKLPVAAISSQKVSISRPTTKIGGRLLDRFEISYEDFSLIMDNYWDGSGKDEGFLATIDAALLQSGRQVETISKVIVSGGGARNPYIKSKIAGKFSAGKIIIPDDIQEQVSRGNALHSLVMNSFGRTIVSSLIKDNVYIKGSGEAIEVFKAGEPVPSGDFEMQVQLCLKRPEYLMCYFGESEANIKYFEIPKEINIQKLLIYIDADQELHCEIITSTTSIPAVEYLNLKNQFYINLNSHNHAMDSIRR